MIKSIKSTSVEELETRLELAGWIGGDGARGGDGGQGANGGTSGAGGDGGNGGDGGSGGSGGIDITPPGGGDGQ